MRVESISALKEAVIAWLGELPAFRAVTLLEEYPAAERAYPQARPALVVGVDAMEIFAGGLGGYWGEEPDGAASVFGRAADITLRFDLLCPPEQGGSACHKLWEALCDALAGEACPLPFSQAACGALEYDKTLAANRLTVKAGLKAALFRGDTSAPIERFDVRLR